MPRPPKYSMQDKADAAEPRKHCPECAFYLDDVIVKQDRLSKTDRERGFHDKFTLLMDTLFPGIKMSFLPGTQFRRYSEGTVFDKVGFIIPCRCATGNRVQAGFRDPDGFSNNAPRMDRSYHRIASPTIQFHPETAESEV